MQVNNKVRRAPKERRPKQEFQPVHVAGVPIGNFEPQDVASAAPSEMESITVAARATFVETAKGDSTAVAIVKKTLEWKHSRNQFVSGWSHSHTRMNC